MSLGRDCHRYDHNAQDVNLWLSYGLGFFLGGLYNSTVSSPELQLIETGLSVAFTGGVATKGGGRTGHSSKPSLIPALIFIEKRGITGWQPPKPR